MRFVHNAGEQGSDAGMPKIRLDNRGFTLIEILVVLALTMMVMGLIFSPLISSLKVTRSAEIIIRTQDNARLALSQITADLGNAMYVYDDTENFVNFPVKRGDGTPVVVRVYNSKVDMILPRERGYCPINAAHTPGGISPGEEAAPVCPVNTCGATLEMKAIQPLTQDTRIVRYFIGLKDPTLPYTNGYTEQLAESGTEDNSHILYRVEFDPMDPALFPLNDPITTNLRTADANRQDENFFYNLAFAPNGATFAANWKKIARPVVTLEGVDLITLEYDDDGNPVVTPLAKFAPTAIYNDPLVPTSSDEDNPERGDAPPATYKASYGYWVMPYKVTLEEERKYPNDPVVTYETSRGLGLNGALDPSNNMCVYKLDYSTNPPTYTLVFNITHYETTKSGPNALFPGWTGYEYGMGEIWPLTPVSDRQRIFTVDTMKGTVNFAFPNIKPSLSGTFNSRLAGGATQKRPLSDLTDTDKLIAATNPDSRFLLNCPHIGAGAYDPRILDNAIVVPGSVKVIAPDALRPGQSPQLVTYTKVPYLMNDPGPNQYNIDLSYNLDESGLLPMPGSAALYFDRPRGVGVGQPALLSGINNVLIYYQVQNNKKGDVLRANYITKSVMTVTVGIHIYDTGAKRPQSVQFTSRVRLKNIAL